MKKHLSLLLLLILSVVLVLPTGTGWAAEVLPQEESALWETLQQALDIALENYYSEADQERLLQGALKGMVEALDDRYSQYLSPQDLEQFETSTEGSFTGVGMEVEQSGDFVQVVAPIKGTPAELAGIQSGDIILAIDKEDIQGYPLEKVVGMIRGEPGTKVVLKIIRHGLEEPIDVEITRELIEMAILESRMLDSQLGYISLTTFSNRAPQEFEEALDNLKQQGALGLVLDLRSNPGGYLTAGLAIAAQFVEAGQSLVHIVDKEGNKTSYTSLNRQPETLPVVVLADGGSASASEIVAGALQDYGIAELVGQATYGKASVQSIFPLEDGGAMKLTTNHYLTPKEREIQDVGLIPDYAVEGQQQQLEKAVEILRNRLAQEYDSLEAVISPGSRVLTVNGSATQLAFAPYLEQGVTMVPLEFFTELFDASLLWDEELKTAILSAEATGMIMIRTGSKTIDFQGREYPLRIAPVRKEGTVFVPLKEIADLFGASVGWDRENRTVKLFFLQQQ